MARTVMCAKLGQELPGLEKQPFPGPLGERIYEHVSADAYDQWKQQLTNIINHYGLNPADAETRQMLRKEMEAFFFGQESIETENLTPDTIQKAE
ncbi:MAG TPA: oxidative damage protection protein [Thermomicrobiales bacterium]|nr:oxidative damage protection protein [Thermomicrobiales bacterium]